MKLGTFRAEVDDFVGKIDTVTISLDVKFRALKAMGGHLAPSHLLVAGDAEIGLAWPNSDGDHMGWKVKIDDPSFPAPVRAVLKPVGGGDYELVWLRPRWRQ